MARKLPKGRDAALSDIAALRVLRSIDPKRPANNQDWNTAEKIAMAKRVLGHIPMPDAKPPDAALNCKQAARILDIDPASANHSLLKKFQQGILDRAKFRDPESNYLTYFYWEKKKQ